ncbi:MULTISPECIES: hypothetical protein [Streptomyces]|uniref:hypothetical protein n=1 Tax=Streptomyces TaxID=1883 RepID=UPI00177D2FD3|nr:hypothetical protein [Streptomyces sp. 7G]MCA1270449.1 hypothetical protein [Streptomyces sp. 7G]GHE72114.1 hypothetical protein GCM10018782_52260 [Streptomyces griseoaurantiacus]
MWVSVTLYDKGAASERPGAEAGRVEISGLEGARTAVFTVGLRRSEHDIHRPAALRLRVPGARPGRVTPRAVRAVDWERVLAIATVAATVSTRAAEQLDAGWTRRPRGGSRDFCLLVAAVYAHAVARHLPPRHVIAAVWGKGVDTVDNWLAEARRRQVLGQDPLSSRHGPRTEPDRRGVIPLPRPPRQPPSSQTTVGTNGATLRDLPDCPDWSFRIEPGAREGNVFVRGWAIQPDITHAGGWRTHLTAKALAAAPLDDVFARGLAALQGNLYLATARGVVGEPVRTRGPDHLRQVTDAYLFALAQEQPPLPLICTLWNVSYRTASSWTSKARRAGVLTARYKPLPDRWGRSSRPEGP